MLLFLHQIFFRNSDRAAYSDLNPLDGDQSLYPMSTVLQHLYTPNQIKTKILERCDARQKWQLPIQSFAMKYWLYLVLHAIVCDYLWSDWHFTRSATRNSASSSTCPGACASQGILPVILPNVIQLLLLGLKQQEKKTAKIINLHCKYYVKIRYKFC